MKCYVFAYGTLRSAKVRKQVLGYVPISFPSTLKGFRIDSVRLGRSEYLIVSEDKTSHAIVNGVCFEVDEKDIRLLDAYETKDYRRIAARMENDMETWVYCK